MAWEVDLHGRSVVYLAIDLDVAARLFHEPIDLAQSQAGSLSEFLCSEERLEGAVQDIGRHTAPGVADADQHVLARGELGIDAAISLVNKNIRRLEGDLAAARHRVARIDG